MIIPLIPALSLALFSFICSAFVILRIIIPILPPNPLSRRVPPSEFGLPNIRSLSIADTSHVWFASMDILALASFMWQAGTDSIAGPSQLADVSDPLSSARLWFALTARQTCLLIVAGFTLLRVRSGQPVSFGSKHWMLWAPTLGLAVFTTSMAAVFSETNIPTLFVGLIVYSSTVTLFTTVAFVSLVATVNAIKRNLTVLDDRLNPWPPTKEVVEKPRPSFATDDVDALRDGSSWITSNAGSSRNSMSAWSFSTHHTVTQHGLSCLIPPVPPLPSPYRTHSPQPYNHEQDPDPFRRDVPGPCHHHQRPRYDSQTSWLTSPSASQVTLSAWSYPPSNHSVIHEANDIPQPPMVTVRPVKPAAFANVQVLGGYASGSTEAGSALAVPSVEIDASLYRTLAWLTIVWLPFGLSLPYLVTALRNISGPSPVVVVLLVLSATISSPLLALNLFLRQPFPIPVGLFESNSDLPLSLLRAPSPTSTLPGLPSGNFSHEYKRSTSVTVVEGRRSTDAWIDNGDAVKGKSRMGRALGMMAPKPRLAMLPLKHDLEDGEITPPLPMQSEDSSCVSAPATSSSETAAEMGTTIRDSKASSHCSGAADSGDFASKIMIAQRHYSALAQTVVFPASLDQREFVGARQTTEVTSATGTGFKRTSRPSSHLRSRSVITTVSEPCTATTASSVSPPPSFPLPPTPPNVRAARLAQSGHRKSFSSGCSFGGVDVKVVGALKVGAEVTVREPTSLDVQEKGRRRLGTLEFGSLGSDGDLAGVRIHSTPARRPSRETPSGRVSRLSLSLSSLGLGNDTNWKAEISRALETHIGRLIASDKNADLTPDPDELQVTQDQDGQLHQGTNLQRVISARSLGLDADVPHNVGTARSSVVTLNAAPPSAASTATLFDLDAILESSPEAESTPHYPKARKLIFKKPSMFLSLPKDTDTITRRKSIVYVKSDKLVAPSFITNLQRQDPEKSITAKTDSPRGGLRPLTLLQDRDVNTDAYSATRSETPPLPARKKQRGLSRANDENAKIRPDAQKAELKPLQLVRSETAKMRGILRKGEILPDVIVRPPSSSDHVGFAYTFAI